MLYETRKVLLGFRLKLTFDVSLNKDISCIFVDVSKTPTVGLLLNNIIERFKVPYGCFISVQNCKVLPSESIHVLLDVNSAKVVGPSVSKNEVVRTQTTDVPDVPHDEQVLRETNEVISGNGDDCDVVDGKLTSFLKPKPRKKPIREGIASTIRMLMEEEEMDKIRRECSGLSISNDISYVQKTQDQESMNVVDEVSESSFRYEELSDLTSDACSDLNVEKKKRKRKRKHSKKHEPEDQPPASFTESILDSHQNVKSTSRKHIRFEDVDVEESLDQTGTMETDEASGAEDSLSCSKNASRKSKEVQNQQPVSTASTSVKSKYDYNEKESYKRPKSSLSLYNGRSSADKQTWGINSHADSENPVSSFINLPRLSEAEKLQTKPKHDQVEKELATLLMCKQLNTCMEYTVQFANEKGSSLPAKAPSSLNADENGPLNSGQSSVTGPQPSNSIDDGSVGLKVENSPLEFMDASSDDCEVLKQVKLDGNKIRLRKLDGTWTVLTSETASTELPDLDVLKENQSVVFRIVYLNQNFCPTSSELLYGRIVSYKADTNKVAIDIPREFIETILKECGEEGLPETIIPITGTTFEINRSALIEPKAIS